MPREIEFNDVVYCADCECEQLATVIDVGYGRTEFWGSVSNHSDVRLVCKHCESEDILHPDDVEEELA